MTTTFEQSLQPTIGEQVLDTSELRVVPAHDEARILLDIKIGSVANVAAFWPLKTDAIIAGRKSLIDFAIHNHQSDLLYVPDIIAGETNAARAENFANGLLEMKVDAIRRGADKTLINEQNKVIKRQADENVALHEQLLAKDTRMRRARSQVVEIVKGLEIQEGLERLERYDRTIGFEAEPAVIPAEQVETVQSPYSSDVPISTADNLIFHELMDGLRHSKFYRRFMTFIGIDKNKDDHSQSVSA